MLNRFPKPGDKLKYLCDDSEFTCHHVKGTICYSQEDELNDGKAFICYFPRDDQFNKNFEFVESHNG